MSGSLLVVGAGRLGTLIGQGWNGPVTAETRSAHRHADLKKLGFTPRIKSNEGLFDNVVMAVPPSQAEDYAAEAARAILLWNKKGNFVFISSTAVYAEENGGEVTEESPLASTPRAAILLAAENKVRKAGGSVVRLAGLYDETSGPHLSYAQKTSSDLRGDGVINLIHRSDAASLALAALNAKTKGQVYLGAEETAVTRASLAPQCQFTGTAGAMGKRINSAFTRRALGWKNTHVFAQYLL